MAPLKRSFHETAAGHLVIRVPTARGGDTVGAVLRGLPGKTFDTGDAVYLVDEEGRLKGLVRLTDLFRLPEEMAVGEVVRGEPPMVFPEEDQESVAELAIRHDMAAVPVVNREGTLLGVVPPRSLIKILRLEHIEDMHRFTGIVDGGMQARHALEAPPVRRARDRLPWLLVGLVGSMLATYIVAAFERTLEERIVVVFFIPGIVYLADAIGTQTEAIVVRGLSFSNSSFRHLLIGEMRAGLLIGSVLGAAAFPAVLLFFGEIRLAFAVSLSIVMAGGLATSIGLLLPWLLSRMGKDPALGSGPVATIIQDVLSVLIYFVIVEAILA
ncbi:MAG: magnesium transporter [Geobacteraceae bacterium]|nr:magnesium transporter [Geobacteraceae bacterium]